MKNYYELLSVDSSAPPEEIKRAFRQEIARYHPDKVQHLGGEFQEMAATRAADLTEAYRTLMNPELRADYDRLLQTMHGGLPGSAAPRPEAPSPPPPVVPASAEPDSPGPRSTRFSEERSTKDEFVRQATLTRIRHILNSEHRTFTELPIRGFDLVCATGKSRLFGKGRQVPNLFVRLVREVNRAAIQETWTLATRAVGPDGAAACVLLLGNVISQREASEAVAALKRQPGTAAASLLLIPVDIRDWSAQVPDDAPRSCRSVLEKLRKTS